ncbi:hypothetical protein LT330_007532 [Penicillium expansum]|nr:hypothetical protein LT330_007532 [Penicillium expansum]
MAEACHPPTAELSKTERFEATHLAARHGNYHQFYTKFRAPTVLDEGLSILPSDILRNARVTDLVHCGAAASVGVDIDPWLVEQAKADGPCTFEHFNFVDTSAYTGTALDKFDVVLLLSVTK